MSSESFQSVSEEIRILKKEKAKILGWMILYANANGSGTVHQIGDSGRVDIVEVIQTVLGLERAVDQLLDSKHYIMKAVATSGADMDSFHDTLNEFRERNKSKTVATKEEQ